MDCKDIDKLITAYLEDAASPEEQEKLKTHLETCPDCRKELEIRQTSHEQLGQALKLTANCLTPSTGSWESIARQAGIKSRDEKPVSRKTGMSWLAIPLSIFLLVVLVGSFIPMLGGMSPPPPSAPVVVSDQADGAFLVWLDKPYHQNERVIRAQHVDARGNRLWGENGLRIADGNVSVSGAVSDGSGGVIVVWNGNDTFHLQRLDSAGTTIWTIENLRYQAIMGMVEDGSGGIIIFLSYDQGEIYAQRVNSEGVMLWGECGVLVSAVRHYYTGASIAGDGSGGAVIIWQEQSDMDMEIRAQRLSAEGTAIWGDNGIIVTSRERSQGNNRDIIGDGTGNFIIAWDTGGLTPDTDIYIQKLDGDGNILWGKEGILVCENQPGEVFSLGNMQSHPQMVADGTGGVIVTWHDRRRIMNREIFAQRINADGEILWAENGVWVWDIPQEYFMTTSGILDASVIPDEAGGVAIVWTGYKESYSRNSVAYAQRLSPEGQRLWEIDEVYPAPDFQSQGYSNIISDGQGGIIIGSRVGESSSVSKTDSVYAQRISPDGDRMWGEGGLEIQKVRSAPTVLFIAVGAVLAAILVLIGIFRRNRTARIFAAIMPVVLGIAGLFSIMMVIGPFGYTYGWAYVPDTTLNLLAAAFIPIAGLAIGAVGTWKRTAPRWVMIPIVVFSALITVIIELIIFAAYF